MEYSLKTECGVCSSTDLVTYLDLGEMPLVDQYREIGQPPADKVPLTANLCLSCFNSQIGYVVAPDSIFSEQPYHSSVSETLRQHFEMLAQLAGDLAGSSKLNCLDIGSNDGCLLQEFAAQGWDVLGVEPAKNLAEIANHRGLETINMFWGGAASQEAMARAGNPFDIITATNVFTHVDDLHQFVESVASVLDTDGIFIVEGSYAGEMIESGRFDVIFHEHVYYLLVRPIATLLAKYRMRILDVATFDLHCGSIRVVAIKEDNRKLTVDNSAVERFIDAERKAGCYSLKSYRDLGVKAESRRRKFIELLEELRGGGARIAGYGAASKANVLVNYCGVGANEIAYIVDDTEDKQHKRFPGTDIMVVPYEVLVSDPPGYIWLSAWDFCDEIVGKVRRFDDFGGKFFSVDPRGDVTYW